MCCNDISNVVCLYVQWDEVLQMSVGGMWGAVVYICINEYLAIDSGGYVHE